MYWPRTTAAAPGVAAAAATAGTWPSIEASALLAVALIILTVAVDSDRIETRRRRHDNGLR